jgi:TPR repeat protein
MNPKNRYKHAAVYFTAVALALCISTPTHTFAASSPKPTVRSASSGFDEGQSLRALADEISNLRALQNEAADGAPQLQPKLGQLALRAARGAERALAAGDERQSAAYLDLIRTQLPEAQSALEQLVNRRIASADFALGTLALHGVFADRDLARACGHFVEALDRGFIAARYRAAQCLEARDPPRAYELFKQAASDGNLAAVERLGRLCLEARPPDTKCALKYIEQAARGGRTRATALLGWIYSEGIVGERPDLTRAAHYYREAALRGDVPASNNLAEMLERGRGVRADHATAFDLYRRAAEAGYAPAQFNVARLYIAGRGTPRSLDAARHWLQLAMSGGVEEAKELLDAINAPLADAASTQ